MFVKREGEREGEVGMKVGVKGGRKARENMSKFSLDKSETRSNVVSRHTRMVR